MNKVCGKTFGSWLAVKRVEREHDHNPMWLCKCKCGGEKEIRGWDLCNGKYKNCKCGNKWDICDETDEKLIGKLMDNDRYLDGMPNNRPTKVGSVGEDISKALFENYVRLTVAVTESAVSDYRCACRAFKRASDEGNIRDMESAKGRMKGIERFFFRGSYMDFQFNIEPKHIIESIWKKEGIYHAMKSIGYNPC